MFRNRPFYMATAYMLWVNNGYNVREVCHTYNEDGLPGLNALCNEVLDEDDGTGCYFTEVECDECGAGWSADCVCDVEAEG